MLSNGSLWILAQMKHKQTNKLLWRNHAQKRHKNDSVKCDTVWLISTSFIAAQIAARYVNGGKQLLIFTSTKQIVHNWTSRVNQILKDLREHELM